MRKSERIGIRVTKHEKNKCDLVLNEINKNRPNKVGYSYLIMEFVNNYLESNTVGLEIQRNELKDKLKNEKEIINEKQKIINDLEIKINNLDHEINNKKLYDLNNFKYNPVITPAINNIKSYCLDNNILSCDNIPNELYLNLNNTYKISDPDLLKNIVLNEFGKWENELILSKPEPTKQDIINNISEKMLKRFNNNNHEFKNINSFLNSDYAKAILNGYLKNSENKTITEQDIINKITK